MSRRAVVPLHEKPRPMSEALARRAYNDRRPGGGQSMRVAVICAAAFVLSVCSAVADVAPQKKWRGVRTPNFYVLGDASDGRLRDVARRLEQFREAIGILLPKAVHESSVATTVLVFKSHKSYKPFKPVFEGKETRVAGYFLPTPTINYITLTTEGGIDNLDIVYHEYVHLIVNNTVSGIPVWFNEGLAEYFRSFEVRDKGKQASLGRAHAEHVLLLRQQFVPLEMLVGVEHDSPLYNENDRRSAFYAESWALVHFLMLAEKQKYATKMNVFVDALINGASLEEASQRALGLTGKELEEQLRSYVQRDRFPYQAVKFTERISRLERLDAVPVHQAAVHATLGDLLMHMQRGTEAREQLEFALEVDPAYSPAHASLGMLHVRHDRLDRARTHLEQAMKGHGATYLTTYYYAYALTEARRQSAASGSVAGDTADIEAALRRTIELNAGFPDAYARLAWHRAQASDIDDAIQLLRRAIALAPGREEYALNLAYLLLQKDENDARAIFERLADTASEPHVRDAARSQVEQFQAYERSRQQWAAGGAGRDDARRPSAAAAGGGTFMPVYRELGAGESRLQGMLTSIACDGRAVIVDVEVEGETIRLRADGCETVDFITYREELQGQQITCGPVAPPDPVLVSYRADPDAATAGTLVAIEFLPR
jgi:tetratricopeptide (TPR) repeat protein